MTNSSVIILLSMTSMSCTTYALLTYLAIPSVLFSIDIVTSLPRLVSIDIRPSTLTYAIVKFKRTRPFYLTGNHKVPAHPSFHCAHLKTNGHKVTVKRISELYK